MFVFNYLRASCHFLYWLSGAGRGKSVQRLLGDCAGIVQFSMQYPSCLRSLRTEIVWSPSSFRAKVARTRRDDRATTVPFLSDFFFFFFASMFTEKIVRLLHDQRKPFDRCPCGDCAMTPTTCQRATGLRFFKFV